MTLAGIKLLDELEYLANDGDERTYAAFYDDLPFVHAVPVGTSIAVLHWTCRVFSGDPCEDEEPEMIRGVVSVRGEAEGYGWIVTRSGRVVRIDADRRCVVLGEAVSVGADAEVR